MRTNLIKPKKPVVESKPKVEATSDGKLDMVIAFDTTGSMSSYIGDVKKHVTELIPKLLGANPDMRIGIVAFGDYCDMETKDVFGAAYQVLPLTTDEDKIISFVKEAKNTHGGDGDEFYELVIKKITEETNWREDATKSVLLIADACPHLVGYSYSDRVKKSQIDWKVEARKSADQGIKWDTMQIRSLAWLVKLSEMTNGVSVPFSKSENTTHLVEAASLARGGERTRGAFYATMDSFKDDVEMSAVYAMYEKEVVS
jgi:hypothetical protein